MPFLLSTTTQDTESGLYDNEIPINNSCTSCLALMLYAISPISDLCPAHPLLGGFRVASATRRWRCPKDQNLLLLQGIQVIPRHEVVIVVPSGLAQHLVTNIGDIAGVDARFTSVSRLIGVLLLKVQTDRTNGVAFGHFRLDTPCELLEREAGTGDRWSC